LFRTLEYKSENIATFPIHEQQVFFSQSNALNKVQFLFLASGGVHPKTVDLGLQHFTTPLTPLDVVTFVSSNSAIIIFILFGAEWTSKTM